MLDVFSKLNQSKAPLDFLICLQIIESNTSVDELNTLIELKIMNKITTLANTAYRYKYNENQRYKTSQVGLFQKGENTFEVHEFINIHITRATHQFSRQNVRSIDSFIRTFWISNESYSVDIDILH